eukprot:4796629-Prymnesium_polylepis.1
MCRAICQYLGINICANLEIIVGRFSSSHIVHDSRLERTWPWASAAPRSHTAAQTRLRGEQGYSSCVPSSCVPPPSFVPPPSSVPPPSRHSSPRMVRASAADIASIAAEKKKGSACPVRAGVTVGSCGWSFGLGCGRG